FDGMMFALRTGMPWRDLPDKLGNWNSIFRRFRRWCEQGVFDAILEILVELGITDDWKEQMIDSTTSSGHSQATDAKVGPSRKALVARGAALRQKFNSGQIAEADPSPF